MGLCYSLRPLLFGGSGDAPCAASEPPGEDVRLEAPPTLAPEAGADAAGTPLPRGGGRSAGRARPGAALLPEQLRAEEREAAREARRVSRGIDRMLRQHQRDLQRTHRLLLLGPTTTYDRKLLKGTRSQENEPPFEAKLGVFIQEPPAAAMRQSGLHDHTVTMYYAATV